MHETLEIRLKAIIKLHYSTQKIFAHKMGLSASVIGSWWSGKSKPTKDILEKICLDTGCSMDWLVLGRETPFVDDKIFIDICNAYNNYITENKRDFKAKELLFIQRAVNTHMQLNKEDNVDTLISKYINIINKIS